MKKILVLMFSALPIFGYAQFGSILKKAKSKATELVEQKADEILQGRGTNKNGNDKAAKDEHQDNTSVASSESVIPLSAYSKFDFMPGERIIYAEDFSQDAIGEFPLQWETKSRGEVVTIGGQPGNWLHGFKNGSVTSINKHELGDNYTIEFDLIYHFGAKQARYVMPDIIIRMLNNYTVNYKNASGNVSEHDGEHSFQFTIHPKDDASLAWMETYGTRPEFRSDKVEISNFSRLYNKAVHYSIHVQKKRLRVWLNETKIFDLPQALTIEPKIARISFQMGHASYEEDEVGYYVSNIRMASGAPDIRHKLLETGAFSTSGILFEANSDQIKPESSSILNELIKMLTDSLEVRVRITGHTSSDGNAAANLELSKKRAQSVRNFISKAGVAADRMEIAGAGDTKPAAVNTTKEGRIQNRRVEFTKL